VTTRLLILVIAGFTSIGGYFIAVKWLGFPGHALRPAFDRTLECVGVTVIFAALNATLAGVVVLGLRNLAGIFVSIYAINDIAWLGLSLLQGLTFWWWRTLARSREPERDR
jgi:type IV secretory pathway VirB3-like protein